MIAPFDSPDLFLRPLLCTTVIRNVVTDVTDFCHRIAVICQTVRDLSMRSSVYNPACTFCPQSPHVSISGYCIAVTRS